MVQKEFGAKKRGRPRAYDPDAALDSALEVFWRAGFASASMDDICSATGMNRPSVYAAFGDKRALFRSAIERYKAISREQMSWAFSGDRSLRETLAGVYDRALDMYFSERSTPLGCFLLGAALTPAFEDQEIRKLMNSGLREFEVAFRRQIKIAQKNGEVGEDRSADGLAKMAAATLYYLAIRSRAGENRSDLEEYAQFAVDFICEKNA